MLKTGAKVLTVSQVAAELGLSRTVVDKMITRGQLTTQTVGDRPRVPAWQVVNVMLGHPITAGPQETPYVGEGEGEGGASGDAAVGVTDSDSDSDDA